MVPEPISSSSLKNLCKQDVSGTLTCIPSILRKEQGLELSMFVLQCMWKLEGLRVKETHCSLLAAALQLLDPLDTLWEWREMVLHFLPVTCSAERT